MLHSIRFLSRIALIVFSPFYSPTYGQERFDYLLIEYGKSENYCVYFNGVEFKGSEVCEQGVIYLEFKDIRENELEGILFEIISCERKSALTTISGDKVDVDWIKKNERQKTSEKITLNNFENLRLVFKVGKEYKAYKVRRIHYSD